MTRQPPVTLGTLLALEGSQGKIVLPRRPVTAIPWPMTRRVLIVCAAVVATVAGRTTAGASHPPEFWRAIAKADFAPPPGADVPALTLELCELFASPDPELRDDVGYSTFASWVYQKKLLDARALRPVTAALVGNLSMGIGSTGTDAVFRRSFSALALSVIVARDNADPVLDEPGFRALLDATLRYLEQEKDVRGFDATKGWMHSAAHTADLIKFLTRSRYLAAADQMRILDAVLHKMTSNAVFVFGEDERYARALLSIVNRKDFDREAFSTWLSRAKPAPLKAGLPTVQELQARQNVKNLLSKLEVLLTADDGPSEGVAFARDRVRGITRDLF